MNRNRWPHSVFRPLVIAVMLGCVALSLVGLVHVFIPTWNATYLIVSCVLAALEANYSYRLIRTRKLSGPDLLRFRIIELLMFFVLLKIGHYIGHNWADVMAEIQTWSRSPLSVFDSETMSAFVLVVLCWHASTQTVRDLRRLGEPVERIRPIYVPPMQTLTERFFWGGAVLLIASGLARIGIAALLNLHRPSVPGLILNALAYYLLGLVMLGQVRLTTLRRGWRAQDIEMPGEMSRRWVRYSLAFIGLAAFLAFLLPTGYTVGLLDMVRIALDLIISVLMFILQLLFVLVFLPLNWLMSKLLGRGPVAPLRRVPPPQIPPPMSASRAAVSPSWFEILRSLLFWVVALGMLYYVIRTYLRDHPELVEAWSKLGPIRVLRHLWAALRRLLGDWIEAASERVPRTLSLRMGRRASSRTPWRFFRLGALSPRERILYYYLSVLRRAEDLGVTRHRGQTPYEYSTTLESNLPEAQREMGTLSRAFVEARYSQHTVERDQARRVRTDWERVKAALRALKRR